MMSAIEEIIDDGIANDTNTTDFPDYDINDSFSHFEWGELAPVLVVYSLTFILGLVGEFNRSVYTYVYTRVINIRYFRDLIDLKNEKIN